MKLLPGELLKKQARNIAQICLKIVPKTTDTKAGGKAKIQNKCLDAECKKLVDKLLRLFEKKDKLEQMIRLKANCYSDFKIQNNWPKDRIALYLEKKEKIK